MKIQLLIFLVPLLTHLTRITSLRKSHESEDPLGSSWNLVTINILQQMTMGLYFLYQICVTEMKTMILMIKPMLRETKINTCWQNHWIGPFSVVMFMTAPTSILNIVSENCNQLSEESDLYFVRFLIMWIQHYPSLATGFSFLFADN